MGCDVTRAGKYSFTVFTPTYNRRHTLPAVFESLLAQTYRDFEWLIVDDGSMDGTEDLVASWKTRAWFPIRYLYQKNSGKHIAMNVAAREACGDLFLTLDSDDTCVPEALARLKHHWDAIPDAQRMRFSAVTALYVDEGGQVVGDRFPKDVLDSDSLELCYRYKVRGEKWGFQRTDVLRQFPFPSLPGVSFIPEGLIWNAIARCYKTRYINEGLRVYHSRYQGHELRLTEGPPKQSSAMGMAIWHAGILNDEIEWFWHAPLKFFKSAVHYVRFSQLAGPGAWKEQRTVRTVAARFLTWLAWPVGWLVYVLDRQRIRANDAH